MAATDAEYIEGEMVTTRKESFKLKLNLMGLRNFQPQNDAKDFNVDRNSQTEQGAVGRFNEQIGRAGAAELQNNSAGIDAGADGSQRDATVNVNRDMRRQAETQQMVKIQPFAGGSQDNIGNVSHTTLNSASYHRVPKLTLPTFNCDVQTWQTFWDSFESTVHQNINLTDVQGFSHLKSQLEGEAARTIDGFTLTHTNYAWAVDLLRELYGQKHKMIHAPMQALLQLPICTPSKSSSTIPIVLEKLPCDIRKHLARQHDDDDWLLSNLL